MRRRSAFGPYRAPVARRARRRAPDRTGAAHPRKCSRTPGRRCSSTRRHRHRAGLDARRRRPLELRRAVGQAREDRRHQHAARDAGLVELRHGPQPLLRVRRAGLGGPPDVLVERADREVHPHVGARRRLRQQVEVAQDERRLGEDRERVAGLGEHLDDAAGQPVLALAPLVRVGVGAHGDVVARATAPGASSARSRSTRVDLHHDPLVEVVADVEAEVLVGRPGEAVGAGVAAAPVGVDREAERQERGRALTSLMIGGPARGGTPGRGTRRGRPRDAARPNSSPWWRGASASSHRSWAVPSRGARSIMSRGYRTGVRPGHRVGEGLAAARS